MGKHCRRQVSPPRVLCGCNCHDKHYREMVGQEEHASCAECRESIAKEEKELQHAVREHRGGG